MIAHYQLSQQEHAEALLPSHVFPVPGLGPVPDKGEKVISVRLVATEKKDTWCAGVGRDCHFSNHAMAHASKKKIIDGFTALGNRCPNYTSIKFKDTQAQNHTSEKSISTRVFQMPSSCFDPSRVLLDHIPNLRDT